jgi:hypothetical protein
MGRWVESAAHLSLRWFDGEKTTIAVHEPRMHRLLKSDRSETRLTELSTLSPGLEAYAFTFVSCVVE